MIGKYEFMIDYDNEWVDAYYYKSEDPVEYYIVYLEENNEAIGLYNFDNEYYPYIFEDSALKLDNGKYIIVDTCDVCVKSQNKNYPNEYGVCNCICKCDNNYRDCRYECV